LSQSAIDGFFAIMDKWQVPIERAGDLLGGMPRSTVYKLKTAAGTLRQDELTRISYVVGIYKALHILLPEKLADDWVAQPNDNFLFGGHPPSTTWCDRESRACSRSAAWSMQPEAAIDWLTLICLNVLVLID
jgi:hypothetical protein